ncbi:hypothetical protein Micbo1qcDRAFT_173429 [Microdochium bolleyi]|uniref:Uncharacterized protein n=1 Tax=Microdochium bolleyi TaxID=196109 RepID=A0A136JCN2_9PEZI|nr:hypothetical protein Micbo1qcDRAFT_173429 [Microdochium bolleyi]
MAPRSRGLLLFRFPKLHRHEATRTPGWRVEYLEEAPRLETGRSGQKRPGGDPDRVEQALKRGARAGVWGPGAMPVTLRSTTTAVTVKDGHGHDGDGAGEDEKHAYVCTCNGSGRLLPVPRLS